jgi:uncharacterized protein (TIGR03086 family)
MTRLLEGMADDDLVKPTPCAAYRVADLLDHVSGATLAFRGAALKQPLEGAASGDGAKLGDDWRTRIPRQLEELAEAWADPDAWSGMTRVGGVDLPGEVAGVVALDELIIHGWDLAVATGQAPAYEGPGLDEVLATVTQFRGAGIEGLFGPEVAVAEGASTFDRILGLAGRDPAWTASP